MITMVIMKTTRNSAIADRKCDAARLEILTSEKVTLKQGLGVTESHWKCHHAIQRMRLPINV